MDRREFLAGSAGVCGLTLLGLGLSPAALGAASAPQAAGKFGTQTAGITRQKNGTLLVDTKKVKSLGKVGGAVALGTVMGAPAALVRTSANSYVALDLRCMHQGVTVRQAGNEWRCPAHGSIYKQDGAFVSGPAGASLLKIKTSRRGNLVTVG